MQSTLHLSHPLSLQDSPQTVQYPPKAPSVSVSNALRNALWAQDYLPLCIAKISQDGLVFNVNLAWAYMYDMHRWLWDGWYTYIWDRGLSSDCSSKQSLMVLYDDNVRKCLHSYQQEEMLRAWCRSSLWMLLCRHGVLCCLRLRRTSKLQWTDGLGQREPLRSARWHLAAELLHGRDTKTIDTSERWWIWFSGSG